ncbi:hypothetical protein DV737_g4574, partial [Chaetothyriales sp. CBS 132003]
MNDVYPDQAPSLLTVILDTNPLAWALLEDTLPLSSAVANVLVFINAHLASNYTNKYRPFRVIESELVSNLNALLSSTTEASLSATTSTHVAGALTLALSYINRLSMLYNDSYIPIMNAVFACQRLNIPIDILQIGLPGSDSSSCRSSAAEENATVFLQQASDATSGIFIPFTLSIPSSSSSSSSTKTMASQSLLTYLLTAFVTSPLTRQYLTPPTAINVDFRAACFCHRRVIDLG